jgi:hypothetical protein
LVPLLDAWIARPLSRASDFPLLKNKLPRGSPSESGRVIHLWQFLVYIAHFWPISKPYRVANGTKRQLGQTG